MQGLDALPVIPHDEVHVLFRIEAGLHQAVAGLRVAARAPGAHHHVLAFEVGKGFDLGPHEEAVGIGDAAAERPDLQLAPHGDLHHLPVGKEEVHLAVEEHLHDGSPAAGDMDDFEIDPLFRKEPFFHGGVERQEGHGGVWQSDAHGRDPFPFTDGGRPRRSKTRHPDAWSG